ncbi:hypothetical protein [Marinibacterium profundimaris]|nr:hypothetical protein [Marinibacterium profundimaris]
MEISSLTISIERRAWLRLSGLAGLALAYVGLRAGLPFAWFFRMTIS